MYLLASQIELTADQIAVAVKSLNINAEKVVFDNGETSTSIIEGGKIKTNLIDVDSLFAQNIVIGSQGSVKSFNYNESLAGFKIDGNGSSEFNNVKAVNGIFTNIDIDGNSIFRGSIVSETIIASNATPEGDTNIKNYVSTTYVWVDSDVFLRLS